MSWRHTAAGSAVALLIGCALLEGLGLVPQSAALAGGAAAWLAGLLLWPDLSRFQLTQALVMLGVGLAGLGYAVSFNDYSWWPALRGGNHSLLAMLAGITFLRLITEPSDGFEPPPTGPRAVLQTLLATHLFGAVINISAPVVIGERLVHRERMTPLQAKVISRAFVSASMWSPFFIAMALILHLLPQARFAVIAGGGFVTSSVLMLWSAWQLPRDPGAATFTGFPLRRDAMWAPSLLSASVIGGYWLLPKLNILTLIEASALGVVVFTLLARSPRQLPRLLGRHCVTRLPAMGAEITMFLGAAVMSAGLEAAVRHAGFTLAPTTIDAGGAALLLAGLIGLTVAGIHPVASISVLAGIWPFPSLDGNLLGMVFLLVWGLGLVASPFSGTSLVFQNRFGLGMFDLLRFNAGYVAAGYVVGVGVLYAYQWLSTGLKLL